MDCSVSISDLKGNYSNVKLDTNVFDKNLVRKLLGGFKLEGKTGVIIFNFQNESGKITKYDAFVAAGMITGIYKLS